MAHQVKMRQRLQHKMRCGCWVPQVINQQLSQRQVQCQSHWLAIFGMETSEAFSLPESCTTLVRLYKGSRNGLRGGRVAWQPMVRIIQGWQDFIQYVDLQQRVQTWRKHTSLSGCKNMTVVCRFNGSPLMCGGFLKQEEGLGSLSTHPSIQGQYYSLKEYLVFVTYKFRHYT